MAAIQHQLMPQLLRNLDNLESFITKSGVHIYNLQQKSGVIRPLPSVLNVIKDVAEKAVPQEDLIKEPQPSTSGVNVLPKKKCKRRILDSDSEDEPVSTPKKVVHFHEPLTEVKGTATVLLS